MILGLKPVGKPTTWMRKTRFWTEPRYCMVLGLKPMGKPTTWMRKRLSFIRYCKRLRLEGVKKMVKRPTLQ